MKRFLIQQGDVYYLTDGELLKYDPKEAKNNDEKKGVEHVQQEFKRIHDEPATWYPAVEIKDPNFSAINTRP